MPTRPRHFIPFIPDNDLVGAERAVRTALKPRDVLSWAGVDYVERGDELRALVCIKPAAHALAVSLDGEWSCECGTGGGLLELLAGFAGLELEADWLGVLELAADVAGVGFRPCTTAVLCDMPCRGIHNANAAGRMTAAATARAPLIWSALQPQNAQGAAYLAGRGIAPLPVGTVRHCSDGTVAIPLRDSNGSVINVIRRRIDGGTPRVDGMWHASSQGTLVGCLSDVSASGGPVYVCEGATDTLAAKVLWPRSTVLGAHYPGNMPGVGAAVGTLLAGTDRALVVVPDKDSVGLRAGEATVRAAIEAGMSPDHVHTHCVKAGDLADDLQAAVRT